jgi:DNA-binding MarR family transcriptional regulator
MINAWFGHARQSAEQPAVGVAARADTIGQEEDLNRRAENTLIADHEARASADQDEALRLWLRMLSCTSLIERQVRSNLRREFDITLPRFDLLAHLDRSPEGLRMGDLSRRMMVTSGNVTGITDQLEAEGLVTREYSPEDRRSFIVRMTPCGRRVFRRMAQAYEHWIVGMFDTMPAHDRDQLLRLLGTLKHDLHETVPD